MREKALLELLSFLVVSAQTEVGGVGHHDGVRNALAVMLGEAPGEAAVSKREGGNELLPR